MRVIGYCRISVEESKSKGLSLENQEARIRQYAQLYELEIACIRKDDGYSGRDFDRPGVQDAFNMLEAREVDGILVYRLDRLTRALADWGWLIRKYFDDRSEPRFMSVSEHIDTRTASGRLIANLLVTVAQWERETIRERIKEAINYRKLNPPASAGISAGFP